MSIHNDLIRILCLTTIASLCTVNAKSNYPKHIKRDPEIGSLAKDAYLDLTEDEEYEDLRAELLALEKTMASLGKRRRNSNEDACLREGGSCKDAQFCLGPHKTTVPGCVGLNMVCCVPPDRRSILRSIDSPAQLPWYENRVFQTNTEGGQNHGLLYK